MSALNRCGEIDPRRENARLQPGAFTSGNYPSKNTAPIRFKQYFIWWISGWMCRIFCGDTFTNADASREIDRLTLEIERLRAGGGAR